jgi:ABC-type sulfate transport system permease component
MRWFKNHFLRVIFYLPIMYPKSVLVIPLIFSKERNANLFTNSKRFNGFLPYIVLFTYLNVWVSLYLVSLPNI